MPAPRTLVAIPVLNRPTRVRPLLQSLIGTGDLDVLFVLSPNDPAEQQAVQAAQEHWPNVDVMTVPWKPGRGDFARKQNAAFRHAAGDGYEFVFQGADDLRFRPDWLRRAIHHQKRTGACVIGTNDLGNQFVRRGRHSTHSLVHVDYLECGTADEDGLVMHEGYAHNFVDNELVETAQARKTFAFAKLSVVEHLHPLWKKSRMDSTYEKALRDFEKDRDLFLKRQPLWADRPRIRR